MLAEKFKIALEKLQAKAVEQQQARAARDNVIKVKFPELDSAFSNLVTTVCGSHPKLALIKTTVTDFFTNHSFATLDKTVIEIRSTLYGPLEKAMFTPSLESLDGDQFGIIKAATEGIDVRFGAGDHAARFKPILDRGILMRGRDATQLVILVAGNFEALTAQLLEDFLEALFIRTT